MKSDLIPDNCMGISVLFFLARSKPGKDQSYSMYCTEKLEENNNNNKKKISKVNNSNHFHLAVKEATWMDPCHLAYLLLFGGFPRYTGGWRLIQEAEQTSWQKAMALFGKKTTLCFWAANHSTRSNTGRFRYKLK